MKSEFQLGLVDVAETPKALVLLNRCRRRVKDWEASIASSSEVWIAI
jgi:hypothetical protein